MNCNQCGHANLPDDLFCAQCGAALQSTAEAGPISGGGFAPAAGQAPAGGTPGPAVPVRPAGMYPQPSAVAAYGGQASSRSRRDLRREKTWGQILLLATSALIFLGTFLPAAVNVAYYISQQAWDFFQIDNWNVLLYRLPTLCAPVFLAMAVIGVVYGLGSRPAKGLAVVGYVLGGLGVVVEICDGWYYFDYLLFIFRIYGDRLDRLLKNLDRVIGSLLGMFIPVLFMVCYIVFFAVAYRQLRTRKKGGA